jgi:hypothetical protein
MQIRNRYTDDNHTDWVQWDILFPSKHEFDTLTEQMKDVGIERSITWHGANYVGWTTHQYIIGIHFPLKAKTVMLILIQSGGE